MQIVNINSSQTNCCSQTSTPKASLCYILNYTNTVHDWAIITASEVSNCQNWVLAATATSLTTGQYVRLIWFGWLVMFIGIKQCVWSIWSVLGWLVKEVISCDVSPVTIFFSYWTVCDVDLVMSIGINVCGRYGQYWAGWVAPYKRSPLCICRCSRKGDDTL